MASLILGTAGHIDHGKTALVQALTGTDTDRLAEEKARGITIELGFAELAGDGRARFGVVDVPGHEGFVRAMVAGAAGVDVVVLVVAADEGMMPQTREHLAIVELLGVPELVVALTKCDLVESDWLELVEAEVEEALEATPWTDTPVVRTSARSGEGLEALLETLGSAAERVVGDHSDDLARLPLDRVFTLQGTGTVVTGTLWSGRLEAGSRVRIVPADVQARIRSVQVHGRDADAAVAGERTALALSGAGADRDVVARGATLVSDDTWTPTWMLTVRVDMLRETGWMLEHNQRVHLHLGTAEVLARVALLEDAPLAAGDRGWIQLRLEEPLVARGRDRFVVRAYSPVTTIGGGLVAESHPPKRTRIDSLERAALHDLAEGPAEEAVRACLTLTGWEGVEQAELAIRTGLTPAAVNEALDALGADTLARAGSLVLGSRVRGEARSCILDAVDAAHAADPLLHSVPLSSARSGLPGWAPSQVADAIIQGLVAEGALEAADGGVRRAGHEARLTPEQERVAGRLAKIFDEAGLAPPPLDELPEALRARGDFRSLVRRLEESGAVRGVAEDLYVSASELDGAARRIRSELGGRTGLGPGDFREVLPVTRKHLIPLLNHFDGRGVTIRTEEGRDVPADG